MQGGIESVIKYVLRAMSPVSGNKEDKCDGVMQMLRGLCIICVARWIGTGVDVDIKLGSVEAFKTGDSMHPIIFIRP